MNAFEHPQDKSVDLAHSNGELAAAATAALGEVVEESKKDKKKKKKKLKKAEERAREELRLQMDAAHPRLTATPLTDLGTSSEEPSTPANGLTIQEWLRPVALTLDTHRVINANKASFLIAINAVMLSIAAHSIYRSSGAGTLWWALIPLALTNLLSLMFAILSAQVSHKPTPLDELWAMTTDEYEPALTAMLQSREHVYAALTSEVHSLGSDLTRRRRHLRTAYNVLLGGVGLSAIMFAIAVAMGSRP